MPREKIKFALRISPETQQLVKEMCLRDNCRTQNEFIEKAIRFYAGYISGQEATAYLPPALASVLRGTVQDIFGIGTKADVRCEKGHQLVQREITELGSTNRRLLPENLLVGFIAGL